MEEDDEEVVKKSSNKILKIIVFILIFVIVILAIAFYMYYLNHPDMDFSGKKSNTIAAQSDNNTNTKEEKIKQGKNNNKNSFFGYSFDEWKTKIELYYGNKYGYRPDEVNCSYDDDGFFVATIIRGLGVDAEYVFDEETGYGTERDSGKVIDFIGGKEIKEKANNKIHFTDNECLAIGYVLDNEVTNFVNIYFEYPQTYYNLEEHDFRSPENRTSGYGNRFVLIPKDDSVYITLYDCYLNDDGEIIKDNTLIENNNEGFIVPDDYIEYVPDMIVKFECNGFEDEFPITFSGEDGRLVLSGHETEVKDISLYLQN